MCPLPHAHLPQPAHNLPQICVHVPEDLARYATGRRPLSDNAQAGASDVVPEVARRATNALLKARMHGSRIGMDVGRGTAGPVESELSQSRAADRQPLTGSHCPPARCWPLLVC